MSAIALYLALAAFIWLDLTIRNWGTKSSVHWLTTFLIGLGWPIWMLGACQVMYRQVDILTKREERK